MRAFEGEVSGHSRAAPLGGQSPWYYRQKTGMGYIEQQTTGNWLTAGWVREGTNAHAQNTVLRILIRVNFREKLDKGIIHGVNTLLQKEKHKLKVPVH